MQQNSKELFYYKGICSLIRNSKELGQKKAMNSSPITMNSPCCWLTERIPNPTNHQDTFLESCQLDKENMSQESETTRSTSKEGILKSKFKMQEPSQSVDLFSQFIAMGKVNSTQLTFTFTFNPSTQ